MFLFGISLGKRVISLDSVFEDSSRPETWRKYEPFREPHHRLDSRFSDADSIEACTKITDPNIGMPTPKRNSSRLSDTIGDETSFSSCPLTNGGCCFLSDDNTNWMHEVSFRPSLTNDTIEVLKCSSLVQELGNF